MDRPLRGYALLTTVFNSAIVLFLLALRRSQGKELPDRVPFQDVALLGAATYKLSRLLTKAKATSTLRSPFTEDPEPAGHGEVEEKAKGTGVQKAIGELLTCPYCMGQWVSAAFAIGFVLAPKPTRWIATVFTVYAIADGFQLANTKAKTS